MLLQAHGQVGSGKPTYDHLTVEHVLTNEQSLGTQKDGVQAHCRLFSPLLFTWGIPSG